MLTEHRSAGPHGDSDGPSAPGRWLAPSAAFLAGCVTVALARWLLPATEHRPEPTLRLEIRLPAEHAARDLVLAPDGSHLAYVGQVGPRPQLFVRPLGSFETTALTGTGGAALPFFSPDGERVGFFADGELRAASLADGTVATLATTPPGTAGATWLADGSIVMAEPLSGGLVRLSADSGGATTLTVPDPARDERLHGWPVGLPGGAGVVFTVTRRDHATRLALLRLDDGSWTHLYPATGRAQPSMGDLLIYQLDNELLALRIDADAVEGQGSPATIQGGVSGSAVEYGGLGRSGFSVAGNGTLVYVPDDTSGTTNRLVRVGRDGTVTGISERVDRHAHPRLSPDGTRLAFEVADDLQRGRVWLQHLTDDSRLPLTTDDGDSRAPVWSADGRTIAFSSNREGPQNIFELAWPGSGAAVRLTTSGEAENPVTWASNTLLFYRVDANNDRDIWSLSAGAAEPVLATDRNERSPAISPDGRLLAYVSDESGRDAVHVRRLPGAAGDPILSIDGAVEPVWSRDGRELFAWVDDRLLRVARTLVGAADDFGDPAVVLERRFARDPGANLPNYDVGADGTFIMIEPAAEVTAVRVVTGWDVEVHDRLAAAAASRRP